MPLLVNTKIKIIQSCVKNFKVFHLRFKYSVIRLQEKLINPWLMGDNIKPCNGTGKYLAVVFI